MVPDHALRLRSMLRAMLEVIIPAIEPAQKLALDQATIVAGNIRLLLEQSGHTADYQHMELREYRGLGLELLGLLANTPERTAHRQLFSGSEPTEETALANVLLLTKQAVDELLKAALDHQDASQRASAAKYVLLQAESQLRRERSWFAAAGFELDRKALPSIEDVMAR